MKKTGKVIALVLAVLLVFLLCNTLYTVQPKEYVAVRQFGRIVNVVDTPGLKAKIPFVQTIQRISAATILYDIPASDVITKDKKSMISDNYVLWRVTDPTLYIQTLNAVEARAAERIEAAVYNSLKKIISNMTQDEIIAARGERLTEILKQGQQVPMAVEKQIMIIYAATHGFLKEYPVNVLKRYEEEMHVFVETNHADILADIRNKKKLDDDLESRMKKALESFKVTFDPNKK